jgi:hypothetical protein
MRLRARREKVFGPGHVVPLDRNAKARIAAYARAWSRLHRAEGQHTGPITRAAQDVLRALLWQFHNARSGCCFPSYERISEAAGCSRSTVALALRALEFAGVLTWVNRIVRVRELVTDLFGKPAWIWRVVRTSNAYVLRDPGSQGGAKSENRGGTQNQEIYSASVTALPGNDASTASQARRETALNRALASLGAAFAAKEGIEQGTGG